MNKVSPRQFTIVLQFHFFGYGLSLVLPWERPESIQHWENQGTGVRRAIQWQDESRASVTMFVRVVVVTRPTFVTYYRLALSLNHIIMLIKVKVCDHFRLTLHYELLFDRRWPEGGVFVFLNSEIEDGQQMEALSFRLKLSSIQMTR